MVPFGAIANMNASALMYVAYAPFVMSYVFGIEISWVTLLMVAPALVLFTIAATGTPGGDRNRSMDRHAVFLDPRIRRTHEEPVRAHMARSFRRFTRHVSNRHEYHGGRLHGDCFRPFLRTVL